MRVVIHNRCRISLATTRYRLVARRKEFARDECGAVLVIVAACMFALMGVMAVAIDLGQALVLKQKLRNAADAAALVVGSRPDLTKEEAAAKANVFIKANYPEIALGTLTSSAVTILSDRVEVSVSATLATTFLRVLGTDSMKLTVRSEVLRTNRKLEVVLALDNTGSMCTPTCADRLDKLKVAATKLVDILFGEDTNSQFVKVGVVPFSGAVNLGPQALGRGWIDETGASPLNREDVALPSDRPSLLQLFQSMSGVAWGGCVRARAGGNDIADVPPSIGDVNSLRVPYIAPDELGPGDRLLFNDYLRDVGAENNPQKYVGQGLTAAEISNGLGPSMNCPPQQVLPLTNERSTILGVIDGMKAQGSTVIPAGLGWAWRLLSPGEPFTEGAPYTDRSVSKAVILLTDGRNQVERGPPYNTFYSSYGFARGGHLGPTDGSQSRQILNAKTSALCSSIKADKNGDGSDNDIYIYTIAFKIDTDQPALDAETRSMLRDCATPPQRCPGQQCFYDSPSGNDLDQIFSKIAIGLTGLRMAQ